MRPTRSPALFEPLGFSIELEEAALTFRGRSLDDYMAEMDVNPLAVAGTAVLEPRGEAKPLRRRIRAILEAANEDNYAFAVTSRYVIATLRRR